MINGQNNIVSLNRSCACKKCAVMILLAA